MEALTLFCNHVFFGSAHVCRESGFDVEGWEEYAEDWRFFFDCMLSPVPKQVYATVTLNDSLELLRLTRKVCLKSSFV